MPRSPEHATVDDAVEIVDMLAEQAWPEGAYSDIPYSKERALKFIRSLITNPMGGVYVIRDEQIVGIAAGVKGPSWWYDGDMIMTFLFYIQPDYRKGSNALILFKKYMEWATGWKSVREIIDNTSFGGKDVTGFYEKFGFQVRGNLMVRKVR